MEDAVKDQSSAPANTGRSVSKLLRYPLRSAIKSKEVKTPGDDSTNSGASKRGRTPSSLSKSMGILDVSGKDKSAKPPRRLSIPAKATSSPAPNPVGIITPISEARAKRSANSQGQSDTPDVSMSSNRKKFSTLSSTSYWLSQIKLSESAAKHSISLGFFKLALESGCEPLQRMREELKSYARKHNLLELGESAKDLFESYNIVEIFEQMQMSETFSQLPEEGTQSSDDDIRSSSTTGNQKLNPKFLNTDDSSPIKDSVGEINKKSNPAPRTRDLVSKKSANRRLASETGGHKAQKKIQKPGKDSNMGKQKVKQQENKTVHEGQTKSSAAEEKVEENKENMNAENPQMEVISLTEA